MHASLHAVTAVPDPIQQRPSWREGSAQSLGHRPVFEICVNWDPTHLVPHVETQSVQSVADLVSS